MTRPTAAVSSRSALRPIVGRDKVARFFAAVAETGSGVRAEWRALNGMPGVVVTIPYAADGLAPRLVLTIDLDREGRIATIYAVSATPKLSAVR